MKSQGPTDQNRLFVTLLLLFLCIFLIPGASFALTLSDLGTQITIADGINNSGTSQSLGPAGEDNETEFGTVATQPWDLEGMFWNSAENTLYIVGGFDFANGYRREYFGDVFIGYDEDSGDYDYVLDLPNYFTDSPNQALGASGSYLVYSGDYSTQDASYRNESNPYAYKSNGSTDGTKYNYLTGQLTGTSFDDWNSCRAPHYFLGIEVSDTIAAAINSGDLIHATLSCGNDTIHGQVPEPATLLLLGTGLLGTGIISRRKIKK